MKRKLIIGSVVLTVLLAVWLWPSVPQAAKLIRANQINLTDVFAFTAANTHAGIEIFNNTITTQTLVPTVASVGSVGSTSFPYLAVTFGPAAGTTTSLTSNATLNRTVAWPDAGGTASLAAIEYCGLTSGATQACAKTVQTLPIIVFGEVTLNTATTQSITTLPFTAGADYSCTGSDLTTAAGIVSFNTYAAASVTIQESGGVNTDHLRYVCIGF